MVETIKAKWSENTGNRKAINEDVIAQGIKENSLVNSDELNAVVHRQDTMLDDLQRGNAWNIGKTYNIGDMIFLNVNYKRLSDAEGKKFKVYLYSLRDDNTQEPFKNNNGKAISFAKNYDYAVTQFIIQVDNDNTPLSHFVNTDYWHIVDATANDLSNATRLNVSNETKLGTLGSDSSIITFNKDLNINNDIITHADFNIKGDLKANRMTTNNNIAFNNAFCATPLKSARNNEIINAEWITNNSRILYDEHKNYAIINNTITSIGKQVIKKDAYELSYQFIPLTKYNLPYREEKVINDVGYYDFIGIELKYKFSKLFDLDFTSFAFFCRFMELAVSPRNNIVGGNYYGMFPAMCYNTFSDLIKTKQMRFYRKMDANTLGSTITKDEFNEISDYNFIVDFSKDFNFKMSDVVDKENIVLFYGMTQCIRGDLNVESKKETINRKNGNIENDILFDFKAEERELTISFNKISLYNANNIVKDFSLYYQFFLRLKRI